MIKSMKMIINKVIEGEHIPNEWNQMAIKAIHKRKSKLKMKNKRGLFLPNTISKLFERVLKERNKSEMLSKGSELQNG